jgi:hypothetical protein
MRSDHLKEYIKIAINNKSIKQKKTFTFRILLCFKYVIRKLLHRNYEQ